MPLTGPKILTFTLKGNERIMVHYKKILTHIPRKARQTGRSLAYKGRDQARELVREQEAGFYWKGKGQLMNNIVVRKGRQDNERSEFWLVAKTPYAFGVESGLKPTIKYVDSEPKLKSWVEGAVKAGVMKQKPKKIRVAADISTPSRPIPWGPTGMKFMRHAFDFMRKGAETYLEQIREEIY